VPAQTVPGVSFGVVLGLVSTKFDRMEPADQLAARISEDAQENKLRLVGEVADRVWGVERLPGRALRHVLEDPTQVAEAHGGVHTFGYLG
jgi:hypothetical protein